MYPGLQQTSKMDCFVTAVHGFSSLDYCCRTHHLGCLWESWIHLCLCCFLRYTAWEVSQYGVSSGPNFTVLGLKTKIYSVNLPTQFEYGKTIQRNHTSYVLLSDTDTIKLSSCDENPTATISVSLLYVWSKVLLCKENIQKQKFVKKVWWSSSLKHTTQPAFTCSKLTIEKLEQGVKYVQS